MPKLKPADASPADLYGPLLARVQERGILDDGKTFVDAVRATGLFDTLKATALDDNLGSLAVLDGAGFTRVGKRPSKSAHHNGQTVVEFLLEGIR